MTGFRHSFLLTNLVFLVLVAFPFAYSHAGRQVGQACSLDADCAPGLYCFSCRSKASTCVRSQATDQFALVNNTLPFNKYSFLATHNSFGTGEQPAKQSLFTGIFRLSLSNQEDSVTKQLDNGVRALMLDAYDYGGRIWMCHSFGGECNDFTAFNPAMDTFKEIEAFLSANPSEIVTLIVEDYVKTPNKLRKAFEDSGLMKFWFPVENMPQNGTDWPLVKDMVASNHRLVVFSSLKFKQESEGIAYQWRYMVENQYKSEGNSSRKCSNRDESAPLDDKTKSLVFINHFKTAPSKETACNYNSGALAHMVEACYAAAGNRWANFVAVDFYKVSQRSNGGGAFRVVDKLNGKMLCGRNDVHACKQGSSTKCTPRGSR